MWQGQNVIQWIATLWFAKSKWSLTIFYQKSEWWELCSLSFLLHFKWTSWHIDVKWSNKFFHGKIHASIWSKFIRETSMNICSKELIIEFIRKTVFTFWSAKFYNWLVKLVVLIVKMNGLPCTSVATQDMLLMYCYCL